MCNFGSTLSVQGECGNAAQDGFPEIDTVLNIFCCTMPLLTFAISLANTSYLVSWVYLITNQYVIKQLTKKLDDIIDQTHNVLILVPHLLKYT